MIEPAEAVDTVDDEGIAICKTSSQRLQGLGE